MFLENVANTFAEFCTNISWQLLRDVFVEDLFRDFTETLMTNWSKTRSTLRRRLCGRLCGRLCARFDRWPIDNSSTTLWEICGRHIWQKYLREQRTKKCPQGVDKKISTRCVKFLRSRLATFETHASVDTQPIANRCVRSEIWQRNRPFPVFLTDLLHYSTQQIPKNRGRFLVNFPVCARALATDYWRWVND